MDIPRVEIDLNNSDDEGLTMASLSASSFEPLQVGDPVLAFESEDQVACPATVKRVDHEMGYVWLKVEWQRMYSEDYRYAS